MHIICGKHRGTLDHMLSPTTTFDFEIEFQPFLFLWELQRCVKWELQDIQKKQNKTGWSLWEQFSNRCVISFRWWHSCVGSSFEKICVVSLELVRHRQTPWLPLCGAKPPQPTVQRASQDGDPQTENPELVQNNHQDLLSGENIPKVCRVFDWSLVVFMLAWPLYLYWQDLVFLTDDCDAIDTGHHRPYYGEDRLQLLQEDRWATVVHWLRL